MYICIYVYVYIYLVLDVAQRGQLALVNDLVAAQDADVGVGTHHAVEHLAGYKGQGQHDD